MRQGGGQYVRSGAPFALGGIGVHAGQNLLGGVTSEGGALGKSVRSGIWNTIQS